MSLFKFAKKSDVAKQYQQNPSIMNVIAWEEWSDEKNLMLLSDGLSVGAAFELGTIATENLPSSTLDMIAKKVQTVLSRTVPLEDEKPWVAQFYLQDEQTLDPLLKRMRQYIDEKSSLDSPFVQKYLGEYERLFKLMTRDEGLFTDPMSDLPYRGNIRRVRMVIFRPLDAELPETARMSVVESAENVFHTVTTQFEQAGISISRLSGDKLHEWLFRWFNPKPVLTKGDIDAWLKHNPYPAVENRPLGWCFSDSVFKGKIENHEDEGLKIDGVLHKILVFAPVEHAINAGVISSERQFGAGDNARRYALFDKCPPGSIYTLQLVFESKKTLNKHLQSLEKAAIGKSKVINEITSNIEKADHQINQENHILIRCSEALYIRQNGDKSIHRIENEVRGLFLESGLELHDSQFERFPADSYLRFLPFNFNPEFDKKYTYRATYKYALDIAKLLPIYGRSRGDGQFPLLPLFNRGGEPFIFDFLNKLFKMANSHVFIVGSTGAGKSVFLNLLILALSAVYRPHIIALEVGNSLGLTADYLKSFGMDVQSAKFDYDGKFCVNPYTDWKKAYDKLLEEERLSQKTTSGLATEKAERYQKEINEAKQIFNDESKLVDEADDEINEQANFRDVLNEMVLATRVMITRGQQKEEESITLTDMTLINQGLIQAMKNCYESNQALMTIRDVVKAFEQLSDSDEQRHHQKRLHEFSLRLNYYVQDNTRRNMIAKEGTDFRLKDFLHIDFGFMQQESYQDLLNIVCISILSRILALAEANKASNRPTILIIDEVHVLMKSKMLSAFLVLMIKVARKIGLWIIPATQNVGDLADTECVKGLSIMETWLILSVSPEEVKHIEKFKPLSAEVKSQLLDIRKFPGLYSEGYLLGKRYSGIFRNIPPRTVLSLAMTEQDERAMRLKLMKEKNLTEMEAVEYIARQMEEQQVKQGHEKEGFLWAS